MPGWVTPDRLTAFGLFGAALVGVGYAASNWGTGWLLLTYLGYAMQWFGDRWTAASRASARSSGLPMATSSTTAATR
jgi:hypothetical protein